MEEEFEGKRRRLGFQFSQNIVLPLAFGTRSSTARRSRVNMCTSRLRSHNWDGIHCISGVSRPKLLPPEEDLIPFETEDFFPL